MSFYQCILLFLFIFWGEYLIIEPESKYQFELAGSCCVYPGRLETITGEPLYAKHLEETGDMPSRHMTWIFDFFVFMQIWNMVCARKIHDEINILSGILTNCMFVIVWIIIVVCQIAIMSIGGRAFSLHTDGLSWQQHAQAIGIAASVFVWDFILKFLPDRWFSKLALGEDSVFERNERLRL